MTESAPPPSVPNTTATPAGPTTTASQSTASNNNNSNGTASAQSGANRGLPYYEKLRRELRDTLQKKRLMDKSMAQLEDQIFRFEQSYLEETTAGNIIKGFDNYIKGSSSGAGAGGSLALSGGVGGARRKAQVTDADRVFSRSSASFMRDSTPSSVQTTPSHAPTPTSVNGSSGKPNGDSSAPGSVKGGSSSSKNKKKSNANKDKNDDDDEAGDKPPTKRLKISYGRD
ncbi:histone acetyltransferase subunit NuA4-domain-containing protein [Aspergillus pseudonomiae]|uniref:Chromatin modification-related protein EAF6 n=1 Tax=Aspergillus pseudonomiae TaxID=1506151 RepID=A0A5N6HYB9_9EURO|nr:histone acetyltransferase subunit NuA4-domain-containing protein [Aspergillus pseudonomiae]KAB8258420.1 histone acetyltransferase subunit NuA4-domain-containing protein [Aspergillus pseudonomiae]KAE8407306.1 histone acetyltransferase subunit NuA4-domain-containing protein [Aspergillus pseudonomiae]